MMSQADKDWFESMIDTKINAKMDKLATKEEVGKLATKEDLETQVRTVVGEEIQKVRQEMQTEKEERERVVQELRGELGTLKAGVPAVDMEAIKEQLLPELRRTFSSQIDAQWKLTLIEEIKQHLPGLMLYGIELSQKSQAESISSFKQFCSDKLKMSTVSISKLNVGEIRFFGSGRSPPTLVKLGGPGERNDVLQHSHHLAKGESLDKYVPKKYLPTYKRFKNKAWKLRTVHQQHTAIDFNGHLLTFKHRKKDAEGVKYSWTIAEEWYPEPTDAALPQTTRTAPAAGLQPTPPLSVDCALLVTGIKWTENEAASDDNRRKLFTEILGDDVGLAENIRFVGKNVVVRCKSREECVELRRKHGGKQINGSTPKWALDSEA